MSFVVIWVIGAIASYYFSRVSFKLTGENENNVVSKTWSSRYSLLGGISKPTRKLIALIWAILPIPFFVPFVSLVALGLVYFALNKNKIDKFI